MPAPCNTTNFSSFATNAKIYLVVSKKEKKVLLVQNEVLNEANGFQKMVLVFMSVLLIF
jgi:hypothetical protein